MVLRRGDFVSVRPANCRTEELQKECGMYVILLIASAPYPRPFFQPTPASVLL